MCEPPMQLNSWKLSQLLDKHTVDTINTAAVATRLYILVSLAYEVTQVNTITTRIKAQRSLSRPIQSNTY